MTKSFTDVNAVTTNDLGTTYHGYNPGKITNSHIDYCFTDEKISPVSQKIIDDVVNDMFPSDHYGLYIKIEI
jgi:endonuclease/exonuclease/phosphatase family metal-dependent hydrolase